MGLSPIDIYRHQAWTSLKNKGVAPNKFYRGENADYRYLQGKKIPSEIEVYKTQKRFMKDHFLYYKKTLNKYLDIVNYDLNKNNIINYSVDMQYIKQQIEDFFHYRLSKNNLSQSESNEISRQINNELYTNTLSYNDFKHYLNDATALYKNLKNTKFLNSPDFQKTIDRLKLFITKAQKVDAEYKKSGKLLTKGLMTGFKKLRIDIQSRFLELGAKKTLKDIFDKNIPVEIVDVANTYNVHLNFFGQPKSGGARKSEYDLLFDLKFKTYDNKIKKFKDYKSMLDKDGNKMYDIRGLVDNYGAIGVQVKSAMPKKENIAKPFNSTTTNNYLTLQDAIDIKARNASKPLRYLHLLVASEYKGPSAFYQTDVKNKRGPIYEPLFNYAIAKNLHQIIGTANLLIATQDGIQYMDDYIYNNNYYIAASYGKLNIMHLQREISLVMRKRN